MKMKGLRNVLQVSSSCASIFLHRPRPRGAGIRKLKANREFKATCSSRRKALSGTQARAGPSGHFIAAFYITVRSLHVMSYWSCAVEAPGPITWKEVRLNPPPVLLMITFPAGRLPTDDVG